MMIAFGGRTAPVELHHPTRHHPPRQQRRCWYALSFRVVVVGGCVTETCYSAPSQQGGVMMGLRGWRW